MADEIVGRSDPPGAGYRLVVALANPEHVDQLMRTAIDLARAHDGRLEVVSVIHKHATSPFRLFEEEQIRQEFAGETSAVLERAVAVAEDANVPIGEHLRVGRDIADVILSVVGEVGADAVLLGWQGRSRASDMVLGTTVDPVVRKAPCDVYVERVGPTAEDVERILLPTDGGPHIAAATDLAGAIARANDASVTVRSYRPADADDAAREDAHTCIEEATAQLQPIPVEGALREAENVSAAILEDGRTHDLIVLGATRERRFQQRVVGSVATVVAEKANIPIVISRRDTGPTLLDRAIPWR